MKKELRKAYWDPCTSLGRCLEWAYRGDMNARNAFITKIFSHVNRCRDDALGNLTLRLIGIIDRQLVDPSRPRTITRYFLRSAANEVRLYLNSESRIQKKRKRYQTFLKTEGKKFDIIEIRETTYDVEMIENDNTLRTIADAAKEIGTDKGALKLAAKKLGISRQALYKRIQKIRKTGKTPFPEGQ